MNKNKWNRKKIKSLKDVGLLIKGVSETVENEGKKQKRGMLNYAAKLGASLLGNRSAGKEVIQAGEGVILVGEGKYL